MSDSYSERMSTPAGRRGLAQAELRYRAVELLGELLDQAGISQKEMARRLGKSESAVSQILGGDRNLTLNTLAELVHALGYKVELTATSAKARERNLGHFPTRKPEVVRDGQWPTDPYRTAGRATA